MDSNGIMDAHTHTYATAREGKPFVRWLNENVTASYEIVREGSAAESVQIMHRNASQGGANESHDDRRWASRHDTYSYRPRRHQ